MEPMPSSQGASHPSGSPGRGTPKRVPRAGACLALILALIGQPHPASAQKVRITNLSDVDFGLLSNLQADSRRSQNICLFSNSAGNAYSVAASGSGAGSAFTLSNGSNSLAYEVEWSDQSGQSNGSSLTPNGALTGRTSSATHQFCNSGPAASASLIIVLRSTDLAQAREGSYTGSLTLLISAE
jgi:hypothetical protein